MSFSPAKRKLTFSKTQPRNQGPHDGPHPRPIPDADSTIPSTFLEFIGPGRLGLSITAIEFRGWFPSHAWPRDVSTRFSVGGRFRKSGPFTSEGRFARKCRAPRVEEGYDGHGPRAN
jgi:hypothetical protein